MSDKIKKPAAKAKKVVKKGICKRAFNIDGNVKAGQEFSYTEDQEKYLKKIGAL